MAFEELPNKPSMFWKSIPEMEIGDDAFSGSDAGEKMGVVRVLDALEEVLDDDDVLWKDDPSELNDDTREFGESDREEASDMAGLVPRYAKGVFLGVRLGRRLNFLVGLGVV